MELSEYQSLTGITVSDANTANVVAQLSRAQSMLETMLGFTLDPGSVDTNLYNETGKSQLECSCSNVDTENLDDPDPVVYAYRLYTYNEKDRRFSVDPFTTLHKVKLVKDDVTIKTYEADDIRVHYGADGWAKYIELCETCFVCKCLCRNCVQVAVDATWLWEDGLPTDLKYVLAEMATYLSDQKRGIKSEAIGPHSYTKFGNVAPETEPQNLSVIQKYAGPHGSARRVVTV